MDPNHYDSATQKNEEIACHTQDPCLDIIITLVFNHMKCIVPHWSPTGLNLNPGVTGSVRKVAAGI